jgi:hypothetical protein
VAWAQSVPKLPACLTPVQCIQHLLNNALKDFCKHPGLNNVLDTVNSGAQC